jgi:ABC-type Fe3+ transport system substrate-binding protein
VRRYGFIFAFLVLLLAPLAVRWMHGQAAWSGEQAAELRLVVITPHEQDVRNEFRWAFSDWHLKTYGQRVALEYLTPGGTNDIKRQLDMMYRRIRADHGGQLPGEDQIHVGIQMAWGGGDYFFDRELKPLGILRPLDIDPQTLAEVFPQPTLAGVKLYDQDKDAAGHPLPPRWVGVCLSSFGIVYNPDVYQSLHLAPPKTWSDLADPRLFGALALADPTHSATASVTYMAILQRAMADAEEEFFARPENRGLPPGQLMDTAQYQQALDGGFARGMRRMILIAANTRYFEDASSTVPTDVAGGDAAAGTAIDFYGRATVQIVGPQRERFVVPQAATIINPDPVAILYGTRGRQLELAQHFVQFLLSPEGQRLWILKVGQTGGPRVRPLCRPPIRQSVYVDRSGWADDVDYFTAAGNFNTRGQWMGMMTDLQWIWAAAWIDDRDDLRQACGRILSVSDPLRRSALLEELSDIPMTRSELTQLTSQRKGIEADPSADAELWKAQQRIAWGEKFREHYRRVAAEATSP